MSNKQQALWQQGQRYSQRQLWRQAIPSYEAIVDHDPGFLPAWMELSIAHEKLGEYRFALRAVLAAARIRNVPPIAGMTVARRLRRFDALAELQQYIDDTALTGRIPPEMLLDLASFFASAGDHRKTLAWVEHALKQRPDMAEAHNLHGLTLMFAGRSEDAAAAFERALKIRPNFAAVYSVLSRVAKTDADHHHVDALRRLLAQPGLSTKDEGHLAYALHTELHDLGDHAGAWDALMRGCRARQVEQPYDHAATLAMFDRLRRVFDRDFAGRVAELDAEASALTPIFIIGLHRSGTTLLERMLSGHDDVADAGETYAFPAQLRYAADHFCTRTVDGTLAERADGFDYAQIGQGFLHAMRAHAQGKPWVTEKLNPNFMVAGLIAKALPHARMLHMRRDPMDTCFSNLRVLFTNEAAYSYDPIVMADFYKAYHDLMAHWRDVLPGRIFDIDYDRMVAEPEAEARRVAAHCGLDFRENMIRVERSGGAVATASSNQVRQGIVRNRGGLWRAYERQLAPMQERLAAHGLT